MAARAAIFAASVAMVTVFAVSAVAQVVVEDDDVVITDVIRFEPQADAGKSTVAAMAMSLAVPGAGHHYLDRQKSAYIYLSIDMLSIVGAIAFHGLAGQREYEARSFAAAAAGIEKAPRGEAYWRHIGAYMDAAEYNEVVGLTRGDDDDMYADPQNWWRWGDESQRNEYNDIRQKARSFRVVSSFFLGALAVNRLVSTIELRVFSRRALSSNIRLETALSPDMNGGAVAIVKDF